jgi:hypothetical protein
MEVEPMLWFGYRKLLILAECTNVDSFGPSISLTKETTSCSGATHLPMRLLPPSLRAVAEDLL